MDRPDPEMIAKEQYRVESHGRDGWRSWHDLPDRVKHVRVGWAKQMIIALDFYRDCARTPLMAQVMHERDSALEENERLQRELGGAEMTHDRLRDQRDEALTGRATLEGIVRRLLDGYRPLDVDGDRVAWVHPSVIVGRVLCTEAEALILKEMQQ